MEYFPYSGRTLIHIPIIHTEADMGGVSKSLRQATVQNLGRQSWERKKSLVERMWTEIETAIGALQLDYAKVRLYQDGLPVCGREIEIVTELSKAGSRNHRLLLLLMDKGAGLMGTESADLLVEEYGLIKQMMANRENPADGTDAEQLQQLSRSTLRKRDRYIAERINATLQSGETGILFLGMLHSPEQWLAEDMRVIYPVNHPPDP